MLLLTTADERGFVFFTLHMHLGRLELRTGLPVFAARRLVKENALI